MKVVYPHHLGRWGSILRPGWWGRHSRMCPRRSPRRTWRFHCRRRRSGRARVSKHPCHCTTVHLVCSCQMCLWGENRCEWCDIKSEKPSILSNKWQDLALALVTCRSHITGIFICRENNKVIIKHYLSLCFCRQTDHILSIMRLLTNQLWSLTNMFSFQPP